MFNNKVSATSDYSAAVTYTGFATEIARKDTYERLADTVAEKMITDIYINASSELSYWSIIEKKLIVSLGPSLIAQ